MEHFDIALLAIRVWLGVVMVAHGINHARNHAGTARWFEKVGFKHAGINARLSAAGEVAIGLSLASGLLTSFGAAGMGAIMFVAFWSIHRFAGFFVFHRPDEGYEYVATLAVVGFALAVAGPGAISVDAALGIAESLDGVTGAIVFGLGLVAGFVQILALWERPPKDTD